MKNKILLAVLIFFSLLSCKNESEKSGFINSFSGTSVEKGRQISELADYRISYYEPVFVSDSTSSGGAEAVNIRESDDPLVITDYGPRDELPSEIRKPSIYAVFSQPVVPLAKLGDPIREDAKFFNISPPLSGIYRWYGTKLLSFEPDADHLPQQRYTITVSDKIKSLGGKSLQGERSFSFETERLSLLEWQLGRENDWVDTDNVHPEDAKYIRLIFSYPVNLKEIANWIEVWAANKTYPFTLSRLSEIDERYYQPEQGVLVTINGTFPLDTDVILGLKRGARSEPGWLGTKEDESWIYHTLLPFRFSDISVRSYSYQPLEEGNSISISLEFNQDVEPQGAEKYFSVDGFPALKKDNVKVYGSRVVINKLPLEHEKNYFVRITADLKDVYGRPLGKAERVMAEVEAARSYVYFQNSGSRMLEAGFPPKIVWEAQNPIGIKKLITSVNSPYDRIPLDNLANMDISTLPANSRRFFVEELSPFLNSAGKGTAAMRWRYEAKSYWDKNRTYIDENWLTVQVTDIGITVRYAYNMVLVWATHLSNGSVAANASVELLEGENVIVSGKTNAQGLAVFDFKDGIFASSFTMPRLNYGNNINKMASGFRVRVTEGQGNTKDQAEFLPNGSHNHWRFNVFAASSPFSVEEEKPVIFLFTDRGLYRPGETVTFRGIDRNLKLGVFKAYQGEYQIEVSTGAYRAPVIISFNGVTTANGGSYGSFTLPEKLDPGDYQLLYRRAEYKPSDEHTRQTSISFTVANFERLRFESSLRFADVTYYQEDNLSATLSASWLSGGSLSGAPFSWYMTREPSWFKPQTASDSVSGVWRNWQFGPEMYDGRYYISQGEGTLGPDGKAEISAVTRPDGIEGAAYNYRIEASVQDAARQEISSRANTLVHPASYYIAARIDSGSLKNAANAGGGGTGGAAPFAASSSSAYFLNAGKPAALSWALVKPDGNAWQPSKAGELSIKLIRHEWKQAKQSGVGGKVNLVWERVEETAEEHTVKIEIPKNKNTSEFISGVFNFTPAKSGLWEVRIQGKDQKDRIAATRFRFYVTGSGWVHWGRDDVDAINLTTDRNSYAPGETAKILVRSPLEKGKYLLTLEREGIISQKIIELEGSALTIDIPIEEAYIPIVYAAISSYTVRSGPPQHTYYEPDLDKPKGIFGVTAIHVNSERRNYKIEIENSKVAYRPAEEAEVKIKVSLNGKPAPATEVTFMAVDRGVVDLVNYHVPDPTAFFYDPYNFPLGVRGADSRSLLIDPVTYNLSDLQGGDNENDSAKLNERKDFRPTAVFEPFLLTGADGSATVKFRLPDSLTTYRCTAVAAGLNNFGIREQDLRVSAPLTAVAAIPRKLRWRDTGTVSLILTNLENETVEASVSLSTSIADNVKNLWDTVVEVDGDNSKKVKILPGKSEEVRFRVAALGAGEAQLTFTLRSPSVNERIIRNITVDKPSLSETVTTIGNLRGNNAFIEEGMILPSLVPEGTGNVMVSLSASRLAALKETVRYLLDYPYGCVEQRTARLLPIVAFGDHLDAFELDSPLKKGGSWNPQKLAEDELEELAKMQLADGSFPYWPGGSYSNYFASLRIAHIAALVKAKGWKIPYALNTVRLLSYLTTVSNDYYVNSDPFMKGYSLWVRAMHGERISAEISAFLKKGDDLGISGWAFAGLAAMELGQKDLAVSTRDRVRRFIRPGTQSLDLTDTYERQDNYWGYDEDRYALALMLFHSLSPEDDMTTRLAFSLLARQRRGVWNNTVSSFWAILAFGKVGDSEAAEWKGAEPLTAQVSLGGVPLLNAQFKSYGGVPISYNGIFSEQPLSELARDTLLPLRIDRGGTAGLYYTASLRYGIPAELASARDEGLCVFVETFDSDGNLVKNGRLKAGKTYTRKIILSSSRDRTYVALRAPVPSGAEIVDSAFVTSSIAPPQDSDENAYNGDYDWDWRYQASPVRFIMDDEARFHWDYFRAGKQEVTFRFRAVMPGVYPTPPSSAECMYEEEIFGRSAGELVRIE